MNSERLSVFLLLILGLLMAFTSLSTDIYLPAMPKMAQDLQGNIELTVTSFLVGFAFAQLIWGPVSDTIGRKVPLYLGTILFGLGSVGCAMSMSIEQIVFWRLIQAIGACTGPMIARAIVRDLFDGRQVVKVFSTLTMILTIAPIIGPLIGGQMMVVFSWHSIFWLLAILAFCVLVALHWLPETHAQNQSKKIPFSQAFANYGKLLHNRTFMAYTLCVTSFYVGVYAFIVGSPKVYIEHFGVDPKHYGWLFAVNILGVMLMSYFNRMWSQRYSIDRILKVASTIAAVAGILLALADTFQVGGLTVMAILIFSIFSMNGLIASCATAGALDSVPEMAGSASALIGSLQYGSGILSSLLLAWLSDGKPWAMIGIICLFSIGCMVMAFLRKN